MEIKTACRVCSSTIRVNVHRTARMSAQRGLYFDAVCSQTCPCCGAVINHVQVTASVATDAIQTVLPTSVPGDLVLGDKTITTVAGGDVVYGDKLG